MNLADLLANEWEIANEKNEAVQIYGDERTADSKTGWIYKVFLLCK